MQVEKGGGEILETDKAFFSPKQLRDGWRLSCQCKVRDDIEIKLPEALLTLKEFSGKVVSNENVATFIKELVVELPEFIEYIPGDYLQIHVPNFKTNIDEWKGTMGEKYYADWEAFHLFGAFVEYEEGDEEIARAYSMASHPAEGKLIKFNIRIATPPFVKGTLAKGVRWGVFSTYIFSLKPGDEIKLSGPFGESHMIENEKELVFLIGGAGSSFGRSHILDLLLSKHSTRKITLWYGARSLKENIYQEEYESLAKQFENFDYRLVLSEPSEEDVQGGWPVDDPVQTNYLFQAFEEGQLKGMDAPEEALYYVCGPPLHNKSVMQLLDDYGVESESVILDDFGS